MTDLLHQAQILWQEIIDKPGVSIGIILNLINVSYSHTILYKVNRGV